MSSETEISWINNRIADIFYLVHLFITIFCAFMWIGPYKWMWWGVFILYGLTEFCWFIRDGYCILTDMERKFRKIPRADNPLGQNYIKRILNQFLKLDIDPVVASKIAKTWGITGWFVASLRIFIL